MPKQARPKERNMDQENRRKDGKHLFLTHVSSGGRAMRRGDYVFLGRILNQTLRLCPPGAEPIRMFVPSGGRTCTSLFSHELRQMIAKIRLQNRWLYTLLVLHSMRQVTAEGRGRDGRHLSGREWDVPAHWPNDGITG